MGYTPLFDSLTTGTLCGRWPDIGLWPIVLSMADKNGVVDKTHRYISGVTGLAEQDVIDCMARFCEPDPYSRTPTENGARLRLLDAHRSWGWQVVNHGTYREKARKQAQQAAATESGKDAARKRDERTGRPAMSGGVRRSPAESGGVRPSDSDANSDANSKNKNPEPAPSSPAKDAKGRPKSKRLPADFDLDPLRAWSRENCPGVSFEFEIAQLRDHQFRDAHSDWAAVVRKWMRSEFKKIRQRSTRPGAKPPMTHAEAMDALNRLPPPPDEP